MPTNSPSLAEPGRLYVVYLPAGGALTLRVESGSYRAEWFNPRSGERMAAGLAGEGPAVFSAHAPDGEDWVLVVAC